MIKCDDAALAALLNTCDDVDEHDSDVALHVESCEYCQSRLSELAADAEHWDAVSQWLSPGDVTSEIYAESLDARERWKRPTAWTEAMAKSLLSAASHPEMLGRIGRYDVERLIGSGGMGVVFKAYDTELNRPVAVKLLAPFLASSGTARTRFAREARAAAAVVDDHVVPIHNVETDSEHPFLVMKYIGGGSLQQRLDREGPLEVCEVLRIGMQTAKGLAAAHAQGLIHRDVKPSNILLDEGVERALLTDFGLARAEDDACLTRSGFHPGTPHYMSPEQVRGEAIDGRSDLFGLGCVLYALSTGYPPFRAETSYAVLRRITDTEPRPIRETNPDVPSWLEQIVMKLLAKSRADRFDSAADVAELLEDCLAHVQQPTTTPLPESIAALAPRQSRRPPVGKVIAAAAFAFSLIFAGVLIVLELNKGTLTIESEADDVPIRIMQGDEIVEKLTVTKSGGSVRIAAGIYKIEFDGEFEGISLKDNIVSLKRRRTETIRIIREVKSIENGDNDVAEKSHSPLNGPYNFRTSPQYKDLSADDRGKLDTVHNDFNLLWGALHRFASEHNDAVPMSLEDLVPRYLKSLPKDPFATATTAAKTDLGIYRSSLGGYGYHYCRGKGQSWIVASVGLPDFPYLAERGNVGLYLPKGRWISKSLDVVPPLDEETSAEHGDVKNQFASPAHATTVNNLSQLMAALHQYHADKGHFPPASILGKDGNGGPPHSWRVEILPWLGEQALYDQYRFDEPWDSQHNKSLLPQIPEVFRGVVNSEVDDPDSVYSAYYAVTSNDVSKRAVELEEAKRRGHEIDSYGFGGDAENERNSIIEAEVPAGTTFFWNQRGSEFPYILDGTSNTIAIVEARRDIPWTQPTDIEYSADKPLPQFGRNDGGWFAAFADGTVKQIATYNDERTIRNLLTIDDGNQVVPHLVKRFQIREAVAASGSVLQGEGLSTTAQRPGGTLLSWMTDEPPIICEDDIQAIELRDDPANKSSFQVKMTLSDVAGKRLLAETARMCEQSTPEHSPHLVILIDGSSVSEPRVVTPIGDKLVISGLTDREQAQVIVSHVRRTIALANQAIDEQHASEPVEAGAATIPVIPKKLSGHEIGEDEEEVSDTLSRSEAAPANRMETEIASYNESTKARYPNLADSPLTPEELIAWASWYVERDVDLSPGMKTALGTIAQEHRLPFNLTFRGGVQELLACEPPVECYRISVHDEETNEMMAIRERFVKPSKGFPKPDTSVHYEGTRLAAAVKRFNARYREINGQRQLPLTEDEVVAAILYEQTKRDGADVSDSLFESLQNIARHTDSS